MAGDKIKEAQEGADLSAQDEGYRNSLERNVGTEEYERMGAEGADALDDKGRYQAREVISEYRNSGKSIDEMTEYYQGLADDGTKFNNRARDFLTKKGVTFGGEGGGGDDPGDEGGTTPTPTPEPDPTPVKIQPVEPEDPGAGVVLPPGLGGGPGTQIVNQDNDVNTSINGDNNTVTNNQDNSVRQYGASGTASRAAELRNKYVADISKFSRG